MVAASAENTGIPPELLAALHALSRADKFRIIQDLAVDLAQDEGVPLFAAGASYPIWTPLEAYDAADSLMKMLQPGGPAS